MKRLTLKGLKFERPRCPRARTAASDAMGCSGGGSFWRGQTAASRRASWKQKKLWRHATWQIRGLQICGRFRTVRRQSEISRTWRRDCSKGPLCLVTEPWMEKGAFGPGFGSPGLTPLRSVCEIESAGRIGTPLPSWQRLWQLIVPFLHRALEELCTHSQIAWRPLHGFMFEP